MSTGEEGERKMKEKGDFTGRLLYAILLLAITLWMGALCFYHLGEAGTHSWDEAVYGINAYEMLSSDNWWIQTYRYEVDYYNLKPPLVMWCIALCFRLFGFHFYAMRLPSAIAALLLFVLMTAFTGRRFGGRAAVTAGMLFVSCTDMIFFHMARSADADALYLLLFMAAMICLYEAEKRPWFLTGCGIFLSLAFLTKCMHMATGAAIVICYLPRIYKKLKRKHYVGAVLGAVIPTGIWAVVRYSYDGFAFFAQMLGIEVVERVESESNYLGYLTYFMKRPVTLFGIGIMAGALALLFFRRGNGKEKKEAEKKNIFRRLVESELYLLILWLLIPLIVYSASGSFMQWYGYICYLPFCMLAGALAGRAGTIAGKRGRMAAALLLLPVICLGISAGQSLGKLETLNYENNTDIRKDLSSLIENYPERREARIYIENERNEYRPQNVWEPNCVADAYLIGDLEPVDGGVPLFVEEEDAILMISKSLFETYSNVLTGRVILVDGEDYLIFSNDFYG